MKHQPVPKVTAADVERVVRRDFRGDQVTEVLAILDDYGRESYQREADRVRLAVLRLAAGEMEALRQHISIAKTDYRDVLAAAEYPGYMKRVPPGDRTTAKEKERVIDEDWHQYETWLMS